MSIIDKARQANRNYAHKHHEPKLAQRPAPKIAIVDGYWFWGRPSIVDLWHDLRAVTREIRPDWDIRSPQLRAAWDGGRLVALPRLEQTDESVAG
jgi:hypothetical protein